MLYATDAIATCRTTLWENSTGASFGFGYDRLMSSIQPRFTLIVNHGKNQYNEHRMFLSKLEIHGFKSFASKVILTFAPPRGSLFPITSIVGPNGSGKSNVVDAIRWVLGEQSMKHLRGKKHEDIIFSGSETKSRLGYAEVAMTLDNADRTMPIDFSEVMIARRYYRDGESEYLLNNRTVRLADITMLLAQSHMGQRSYSVIGQGMVDHLLLATPRERKEMINEAAGIRPYELKRNDAQNRMTATRENLRQGQTVLGEIEPRMRTLTRMVKRLERRAELETTLAELKHEYYGALWKESVLTLSSSQKKQVDLAPTLATINHKRSTIDEHLKNLQKEKPVSSKLMELQRAVDDHQRKREHLKERLWALKLAQSQQQSPSKSMNVTIIEQELTSLIERYEQHLHTAPGQDPAQFVGHFQELMTELRGILKRLKPTTPDHRPMPEIEAIEKDLVAIDTSLMGLRDQMKGIEQEEHASRASLFTLQNELRTLDQERDRLERAKNDIAIEQARTEAHHEDLANEIRQVLNGEPVVVLADPLPHPRKPLIELREDIHHYQHEIELIGGIDPEVAQEYQTTKERFEFLTQQSEDLAKALSELERVISNLDETMAKQFDQAFGLISKEFSRYFSELFGGGKGQLLLMAEEPPLESSIDDEDEDDNDTATEEPKNQETKERAIAGIDIMASPPGKKVKSVAMLSGGEKALTAIALLCAILSYHPSPFVVLDEVDAALDEANSVRYSNILKQLAAKTQFLVVTHNRTTMHIAQTFYGVTMGEDGISQILSMKLEEAEEVTPEA